MTKSKCKFTPTTLLLLLCGFFILNCDQGNGSVLIKAPITGITLDSAITELEVGKTDSIQVTVLPVFTTDSFAWRSSNPNIVTVNSQGVIMGIAEGSANIIVFAKEDTTLQLVVPITITIPIVTGIEIVTTGINLNQIVGDSVQLMANLLPVGAVGEIVWNSNPLRQVSASGLIIFISQNPNIKVTATANNFSDTITFIVRDQQ